MATALEWVIDTMLDEMDKILDEREGFVCSRVARLAGREAMRQRVAAIVKNEEAAIELRNAGPEKVRAAVRRMYDKKTHN